MSDVKLSLIINSAALDPKIGGRSNPHRQSAYADRAAILRNEILPAVTSQPWDEILVVGVWEEGPGYEYIPMQPRYRDRRDALWQRDLGTRASTGDILTFVHDDHRPTADYADRLREALSWDIPWDIIVPKRVHGQTGEELNNGHSKWSAADGRPEEWRGRSYMGGHCVSMRRWVPVRVPWTLLDTEFWDLEMSSAWLAAGAEIVHRGDLIHLDLEAGLDER